MKTKLAPGQCVRLRIPGKPAQPVRVIKDYGTGPKGGISGRIIVALGKRKFQVTYADLCA
jgi:hypothetical protein